MVSHMVFHLEGLVSEKKIKFFIIMSNSFEIKVPIFSGSLQRAQQYFGRLDIVVNNAGIANEDTWIEMIDINLVST